MEKLITCVLYKGGGDKIVRALHDRGINTANFSHARGSAIGDHLEKNGLPRQFEKEVLTVIVNASEADEIFELIYDSAEINRPHGGFLYMEALSRTVPFILPKIQEEKSV